MSDDQMFALAQALAVAESRQDVPAALEVLHPQMVLRTPAFGSVARGHAENDRVLTRFFGAFPDYDVELDFVDDLIASETFFFDLASLCAQSGVSTDAVQRALLAAAAR